AKRHQRCRFGGYCVKSNKFYGQGQLFFIYILNYQKKLGKICLLTKFCQSGYHIQRWDRLAEEYKKISGGHENGSKSSNQWFWPYWPSGIQTDV
ncbi:MAG: hypothetical protein NC517_11650, partial [Firmicutes bacterium]|nr:hypothetical protein [Bacillota bacterium]